jgi:hypothetical protein
MITKQIKFYELKEAFQAMLIHPYVEDSFACKALAEYREAVKDDNEVWGDERAFFTMENAVETSGIFTPVGSELRNIFELDSGIYYIMND